MKSKDLVVGQLYAASLHGNPTKSQIYQVRYLGLAEPGRNRLLKVRVLGAVVRNQLRPFGVEPLLTAQNFLSPWNLYANSMELRALATQGRELAKERMLSLLGQLNALAGTNAAVTWYAGTNQLLLNEQDMAAIVATLQHNTVDSVLDSLEIL
jgi:hypothetical protein